MAVISIYSKTQCDALLPRGDGYGEIFNDCVRAVRDVGYYEYHAGLQWSDFYRVIYPLAAIGIVVIAVCLVVLVLRTRKAA